MKSAPFLQFSPPFVGENEVAEVLDAMRSTWITAGPRTKQFEHAFRNQMATHAALPLSSCTAALHTALVALGIGSGDDVVTTPVTFAASANVIEHVGARPVFADVDADTLNIDPQQIRNVVTARTRAIIPVHLAGHPCEMDEIRAIADEHGLSIIEDAAHAIPAKYKGRMIGSWDNAACFSFYATKNLTTGEGGMLTGSEELVEKARALSLHGMSRDAWKRYEKGGSWKYDVVAPGWKYNMTDIAAAIGLVQLEKLPAMQKRRREVWDAYNAAFSKEECLQVPVERPEVESALHLYVLRLHLDKLSIDRDRFIELMTEAGIGTSVHFIPVHTFTYYREKYGYKPEDFPVAWSNFQRMLSLPLHPGLSDEDVQRVIDAVLGIVEAHRS